MHDDRELVERRIDRVQRERIAPAVYRAAIPMTIEAWRVPGEPIPVSRALADAQFAPFLAGTRWGEPWSTVWFRVTGTVPEEWTGSRVEALYDLGFTDRTAGFQAEGLVYDESGTPIKGLEPLNHYVPLRDVVATGGWVVHLIEAAANPDIIGPGMVPTPLGDRLTAGQEKQYVFARAELGLLDENVFHLNLDIQVLRDLMRQLELGSPRRHEILRSLEDALDVINLADISGTAAPARDRLAVVLSRPASPSAHTISAVGHAHIDSAWLWPVRETIRKTSRTFSNVVALADEYPELVFACSQAQQYAWVKEHFPPIFQRIKKAIADGTWAPVGGMWVEADGNLPGGEALARQLVHGTRFFRDELAVDPHGVWLPDSFGYSAAYPQLARLAGFDWFLTQKISWNDTNTFPHHTFWWEGIDGSRIFTHFPPADTYNGDVSGGELAHAERNYAEKGRGTTSLYPFGHGDGGGGPTREMLEKSRRVADLEGSPRVVLEHPDAFFARAQSEYPQAPVWVGELYLELHRGTFTSQAKTKQGNRRSEHLLREAELFTTMAALRGADYPAAALDALWKTVLLNQFHDILPGTSIAWVHREAEATYARVAREVIALSLGAARSLTAGDAGTALSVLNTAPYAFSGVVNVPAGDLVAVAAARSGAQGLHDGSIAVAGRVPASGAAVLTGDEPAPDAVTVVDDDHGIALSNFLVALHLDHDGLIDSVTDLRADRELLPAGGRANLLQLHPDFPNDWDAWDIEQHYRHVVQDLTDVDRIEIRDRGPLVAAVRVSRRFGESTVDQDIVLRAGSARIDVTTSVDWQEREKLLKVAFPLDVHAERFSGEIQFGHVHRPIAANTSWDVARFEVPCHRWVHIGEPGYGVAVVNESTYGHEVVHVAGPDPDASGTRPRTSTVVRLSLLRAPRVPDPQTDLGRQRMRYGLVPGADIAEAIRHGYEMNLPLRVVPGSVGDDLSMVTTESGSALVESVKMADDDSGDLVLRVYESQGQRSKSRLRLGVDAARVSICDLHERPIAEGPPIGVSDRGLELDLRPFQILTLRVTLAQHARFGRPGGSNNDD